MFLAVRIEFPNSRHSSRFSESPQPCLWISRPAFSTHREGGGGTSVPFRAWRYSVLGRAGPHAAASQVVNGGYNGLKALANGSTIFVAPDGLDWRNAMVSGKGWSNEGDGDMKFFTAMLDAFNEENFTGPIAIMAVLGNKDTFVDTSGGKDALDQYASRNHMTE
jgi:hypothetical protein